jgi:hypothetical protein
MPNPREADDELPHRLLFSPSLSEGQSSAPRFGRSASPSLSYAEVVCGKGRGPLGEDKPKEVGRPGASQAPGGFMADAHRVE